MGLSKTKKALKNLKQRVENTERNLKILEPLKPTAWYEESIEFVNELKTLIEAYEEQIELNKKQNIKIRNQKGFLRALLKNRRDNQ